MVMVHEPTGGMTNMQLQDTMQVTKLSMGVPSAASIQEL
jgi:hypothetical protein